MNFVLGSKRKNTSGAKGFTLIELLLSVGLLALTIGLAADIIVTLVRTNGKVQVFNEVEQEANYIFLRLQRDIREALSAEVVDSNTLRITPKVGEKYTYVAIPATATSPATFTRGGYDLTDTVSNRGSVVIECNGSCFTQVGTSPTAIQINLTIRQRNAASNIFSSSVTLSDIFTVRASY